MTEAERAKIFLTNLKELVGVRLDAKIEDWTTERQKIGRMARFRRDGNKWLKRVCDDGLARRHSGKTGKYLEDLAKALGLYRPDDFWIEGQKRNQLVMFALRRFHSVAQDSTSTAARVLKKFGDDWLRKELTKAAAQLQIDPAMSDDDVYKTVFIPALKEAIHAIKSAPDEFADLMEEVPVDTKVATGSYPIGYESKAPEAPVAPAVELTPEQKICQGMVNLFRQLLDDMAMIDDKNRNVMIKEIGGTLRDWRKQVERIVGSGEE